MNRSPRFRGFLPIAGLALLLALAGRSAAQDNDTCLKCHAKPALKSVRDGKEVSLFVDPGAYAKSVHGGQDCINCHYELEDAEYPHRTGLERVDCAECHEEQGSQHAESRHGQAAARHDDSAPTCAACHGKHDILSHTDESSRTFHMNIPRLCGSCHHEGTDVSLEHDIPQERIFENYSMSLHGEGLYKAGLKFTAVCTSCHTTHFILPHTDPRSSIHPDNVSKTCTKCHVWISQVHQQVIEGKRWQQESGQIPHCTDCHSPHRIRREQTTTADMFGKSCLTCHGDKDLAVTRDGKTVSLYVDEFGYSASTHAGVECAQCHTEVSRPLEKGGRPCWSVKSKVDCLGCHEQPVTEYRISIHGTLAAKGDPDAPTCLDCHSKHTTQSRHHPLSPTFPRNVPELCGKCHREGERAAKRIEAKAGNIVGSYLMSIHGRGLKEAGLTVTATCASCHSAHKALPPTDPRATVNDANVADTCGKCHNGIEEQFRKSIHWPGNVETDRKLPTCEDCHTSHSISRHDEGNFRFRMMDQCGRCHEEQAGTFFETFHGKVSRLGSEGAAKCYDCHGSHNILPTTNPASTLSREHVVQTCGQCHEGAHRRFAGYLTHATHHDPDTYPWLFWTFWLMTGLLIGTLAVALLHTLAWLLRLSLTRTEWKKHKALAHAARGEKLYRRFNRYQRTQHLLMILSFFTLALTGMSLKFSYMGWARGIAWAVGGGENAGVLHRFAAVVLFGVFVSHLYMVRNLKRRRGVSWLQLVRGPDSIIFNRNDWREFIASLKWFFGLGPRPDYGRYAYWEKFDYFAVFWGVFVIGSTGLILWFPEIFTRVVPGWFVNVATIIHSDEALLAVGFIFTIHFFNTHFRPDKFPMDPVIFTGRVPIAELKHDKPGEYAALLESGRLEKHLVDAFPRGVERGFRIFGFVALGIGLSLIALIVYAMLFGYR